MLQAIDPQSVRVQTGTKTSSGMVGFSDVLDAMAPASAEAAGQASNNAGVSAVTHAAITGVASAPSGARSYGMTVQSPFTGGGYATPSYVPSSGGAAADVGASLGTGGYAAGTYGGGGYLGGAVGGSPTDPLAQTEFMIQRMRDTNLEMITIQAQVQSLNRDWTTRSNVLKAKHDTEMAQVRNFRVT